LFLILFCLYLSKTKIMGTYWNMFINEYSDRIPFKSLEQILEAFFHYSKNQEIECNEIMNK